MKTLRLVVAILLSVISCSIVSAGEKWTNIQFRNPQGELVTETFVVNIPKGFCNIDVIPDSMTIKGRAVDYSKSTDDESVEICERFSIINNHGWIRIARENGILTTIDKEGKIVDEFTRGKGYDVFTKKCSPRVKGSNLPLKVQEALVNLE